jgi:hypothetical protein
LQRHAHGVGVEVLRERGGVQVEVVL